MMQNFFFTFTLFFSYDLLRDKFRILYQVNQIPYWFVNVRLFPLESRLERDHRDFILFCADFRLSLGGDSQEHSRLLTQT